MTILIGKAERRPQNVAMRCCLAFGLPCVYYSLNIDDDYEDGLPECKDKCLICCSGLWCPTLIPSLFCSLREEKWCERGQTTTKFTNVAAISSSKGQTDGAKSNVPDDSAVPTVPVRMERE